jgi:hypothetical protein
LRFQESTKASIIRYSPDGFQTCRDGNRPGSTLEPCPAVCPQGQAFGHLAVPGGPIGTDFVVIWGHLSHRSNSVVSFLGLRRDPNASDNACVYQLRATERFLDVATTQPDLFAKLQTRALALRDPSPRRPDAPGPYPGGLKYPPIPDEYRSETRTHAQRVKEQQEKA